MSRLHDATAREQACDPRGSYLVQAPAGSGKTELLTRRFLRLLAVVEAPEQIVALTFTRKAANEMRERVVHALLAAQSGTEPASEHAKQTRQLAREALANSVARHWQLAENPGRLRIMTIDALCSLLTRAMPCQDDAPPPGEITESPRKYYLAAARACLDMAESTPAFRDACETLLRHLDNRKDHLIAHCCDLLARRESWLPALFSSREMDRSVFETALLDIERHEIARFTAMVPEGLQTRLCDVVRETVSYDEVPASPRHSLREWRQFTVLSGDQASALASMLLTSANQFRLRFDYHVGLRQGVCEKSRYQFLRAESEALLETLSENKSVRQALIRLRNLPNPQYDDTRWNVLQALLQLLPLLAGHLELAFSDARLTDFTGISQRALESLGDDTAPGFLALHLDRAIHHLLVDEFQDTSLRQFALLERLVAGWEPGDGRSIFAVGDPMQSVYRFREAEVGLFLKAREQGLGGIPLVPLTLSCNFRASVAMVTWVNQHFAALFPDDEDIESGAIRYSPSHPVRTDIEAIAPEAFRYPDTLQEAYAIAERVTAILEENPGESVAILARSRSRLAGIIRVLRERNIPFQGVDTDCLANLPHLQDAWSLTCALLDTHNRLAWLSLLRSPWCGLPLADLHALASHDRHCPIIRILQNRDAIPGLGEDARHRLGICIPVLEDALRRRGTSSLATHVADVMKALGGNRIFSAAEHADIEQYLQLLANHEQHGHLPDTLLFLDALSALYSRVSKPSNLQIMTIHKSKGLEFDTVILPAIGRPAKKRDTPLIRTLRLPTASGAPRFLLSPLKSPDCTETCPLHDYLGLLEDEKSRHELQRLLYVAVTRAKKRLVLFDGGTRTSADAFSHMLPGVAFTPTEAMASCTALPLPVIRRLPAEALETVGTMPDKAGPMGDLSLDTAPESRLSGTLMHELLEWAAHHHPEDADAFPWHMVHNRLRAAGLDAGHSNALSNTLHTMAGRFLADPRGRWLTRPHDQSRTEWELLVPENGRFLTLIVDRSFVCDGIRWIIDYKTGIRNDTTLAAHRQQVNHYARLCERQETHPIRCGLYYLLDNHWLEWPHESTT